MKNAKASGALGVGGGKKTSVFTSIRKDYYLYLLFVPTLIYYIIFVYWPMYGVIIAFKDYNIIDGILGSPWVGLKHFKTFFNSIYCGRLIRNTLILNLYDLAFNFTSPIIFALLLHELKDGLFKKAAQTISYLPHFISTVIVASMVISFLQYDTGLINNIIAALGGQRRMFLSEPQYFRMVYTLMNFWKNLGWGSIIYLATMSGINTELYEACSIDGGGKLRQMWHVTLPGIRIAIVIQLILKMGHLLSVGYESIILLYNTATYETADVISTYVFRRGILDAKYSFSTAVNIFQSVIGLILVVTTNKICRKLSEVSLW